MKSSTRPRKANGAPRRKTTQPRQPTKINKQQTPTNNQNQPTKSTEANLRYNTISRVHGSCYNCQQANFKSGNIWGLRIAVALPFLLTTSFCCVWGCENFSGTTHHSLDKSNAKKAQDHSTTMFIIIPITFTPSKMMFATSLDFGADASKLRLLLVLYSRSNTFLCSVCFACEFFCYFSFLLENCCVWAVLFVWFVCFLSWCVVGHGVFWVLFLSQ